MDAETKICPQCAETIKAAAKKCPRCRSGLIKTKTTGWFELGASGFLFFAPLILLAWLVRGLNEPGETFDQHRSQIIVTNTTTHYSRSDNANIIAVVGYLVNESSFSWKSLQLEAQFFDANGKLVDTKTETLPYQELPASMTQAFRIRAVAATGEEHYASHKVVVRAAKDARKFWNAGD